MYILYLYVSSILNIPKYQYKEKKIIEITFMYVHPNVVPISNLISIFLLSYIRIRTCVLYTYMYMNKDIDKDDSHFLCTL